MSMCRECDIEIDILGEKRDNYTIPEYKAVRQAADELTAELEILNAERQEAEAVIASINSEVENSREEVSENTKHLAEINAEIAEREKRYSVFEKKIDKLTSQVSSLKDKISKAETFLKVKGLLEEFLDYLKPKSISRSLSEKKKEVEEYDKTHANKVVKKDRGIAV